MDKLATIAVVVVIGALGASVVWALWWAIRGGQFSNFQAGAASIFDGEEPQGKRTDGFPDEKPEGGEGVVLERSMRKSRRPTV